MDFGENGTDASRSSISSLRFEFVSLLPRFRYRFEFVISRVKEFLSRQADVDSEPPVVVDPLSFGSESPAMPFIQSEII